MFDQRTGNTEFFGDISNVRTFDTRAVVAFDCRFRDFQLFFLEFCGAVVLKK
jgi:hypothetical protein